MSAPNRNGIDNIRSADAVVSLDPAKTRFDVLPEVFVAGKLREAWDARNSDGITPRVEMPEGMKGIRYEPGKDFITVYPPEAIPGDEPAGTPQLWKNEILSVTLEFVCGYKTSPTSAEFKHHMKRVAAEAERIIQSARFDPFGTPGVNLDLTGRQWLKWGARKTNPVPWANGTYRFERDVEVHWRFREVQTG